MEKRLHQNEVLSLMRRFVLEAGMAQVKIRPEEIHPDFLPHLCIRCGASTEEFMEKSFRLDTSNDLPIGGIIGLIFNTVRTTMVDGGTVFKIPICPRHRLHWAIRKAVIFFGILFIIFGILVYYDSSTELENRFGVSAFFVYVGLLLGSIIFLFVFWLRGIRMVGMDEGELIIVNVHELFRTEIDRKYQEMQVNYEARKLMKEYERLKEQYPDE